MSRTTERQIESRDDTVRQCFCGLCQQTDGCRVLYRVQREEIVRCGQCGLVFVATQGAGPDVRAIYSQGYYEGGAADGYSDYSASETTLRHQGRRMLRRIRKYQPSGSLLEIGCAYGYFLQEAKAYFKAQGVEISSFAAQEARRRGLDVVDGDFRELDFPLAHYSLVCLFDCIEHLAEPLPYLEKVHSVLAHDGILALTTGDIGSLYARISGAKWRLMTPPQHLYFFSKATLTRMLHKAGFRVLEVSYPWKLVPLDLILYQLSPRLKKALGPLGRLQFGFLVNLFDAMLVVAAKT